MSSSIHMRLHERILWLMLDRPPLNLLSIEMLDQLAVALRKAPGMEPRLVVLMGAGEQAFSAGSDVRDFLEGREQETLRAVTETCAAFEELRARSIPTVALVRGVALGGGCELAALCDTVLAHEDARFGLPEIGQGIFPPVASVYFPALLGYSTTMRLLLTGETLSAREALRLGLAHQVLSARRFRADVEELLVMLASLPPQSASA